MYYNNSNDNNDNASENNDDNASKDTFWSLLYRSITNFFHASSPVKLRFVSARMWQVNFRNAILVTKVKLEWIVSNVAYLLGVDMQAASHGQTSRLN